MRRYVEVCPVSDDCPFEASRGADWRAMDAHIEEAHPSLINRDPASTERYTRPLFKKYRRA